VAVRNGSISTIPADERSVRFTFSCGIGLGAPIDPKCHKRRSRYATSVVERRLFFHLANGIQVIKPMLGRAKP